MPGPGAFHRRRGHYLVLVAGDHSSAHACQPVAGPPGGQKREAQSGTAGGASATRSEPSLPSCDQSILNLGGGLARDATEVQADVHIGTAGPGVAMPSPLPARERDVYFVGAGLPCALGLPNTAMLLDGVLDLADHDGLGELLKRAFKFFYPDAVNEGYRPDVVDFFSSLRTYLDVGVGLPGGFADAPHLYRSLKRAIADLLIKKTRKCNATIEKGHPYLSEVVQPGNVVVTSNWDVLIERYASLHDVPVRLTGTGHDDELGLLKLHGSIDWCLGPLQKVWRDAYGAISRARRLEIVGYSMPADDIEIRTLLRAGVQRGEDLDGVSVRNPAPDVHVRIRQFLDRDVTSDYRGVSHT